MLTACRSGEVRGACWEEIDVEGGEWTIPAERMKNRREHRVPLSARVREILAEAKAHVVRNKVEAAYARSDLFERRRVLMEQWRSSWPTAIRTCSPFRYEELRDGGLAGDHKHVARLRDLEGVKGANRRRTCSTRGCSPVDRCWLVHPANDTIRLVVAETVGSGRHRVNGHPKEYWSMLVYASRLRLQGDDSELVACKAIGGWLKEQLGFGLHPDQLLRNGDYKGQRGEHPSRLRIYSCYDGEPALCAWVLKHEDADVCGRRWTVEVGVKKSPETLEVSCVVKTDERSTLVSSPVSASQPRVIRYIHANIVSAKWDADFAEAVPGVILGDSRPGPGFVPGFSLRDPAA